MNRDALLQLMAAYSGDGPEYESNADTDSDIPAPARHGSTSDSSDIPAGELSRPPLAGGAITAAAAAAAAAAPVGNDGAGAATAAAAAAEHEARRMAAVAEAKIQE